MCDTLFCTQIGMQKKKNAILTHTNDSNNLFVPLAVVSAINCNKK